MRLSYPHLGSIPDYNMSEFEANSSYNKHIGRELLIIMSIFGFNFNYQRKIDKLTPLEYAIERKDEVL